MHHYYQNFVGFGNMNTDELNPQLLLCIKLEFLSAEPVMHMFLGAHAYLCTLMMSKFHQTLERETHELQAPRHEQI
jgi:hypothetical protein